MLPSLSSSQAMGLGLLKLPHSGRKGTTMKATQTMTMKIKQLSDAIRETKLIKRDFLGQVDEINAIAGGIDEKIVIIEMAIGTWGNASTAAELTAIKAAMASLHVIANDVKYVKELRQENALRPRAYCDHCGIAYDEEKASRSPKG